MRQEAFDQTGEEEEYLRDTDVGSILQKPGVRWVETSLVDIISI